MEEAEKGADYHALTRIERLLKDTEILQDSTYMKQKLNTDGILFLQERKQI